MGYMENFLIEKSRFYLAIFPLCTTTEDKVAAIYVQRNS